MWSQYSVPYSITYIRMAGTAWIKFRKFLKFPFWYSGFANPCCKLSVLSLSFLARSYTDMSKWSNLHASKAMILTKKIVHSNIFNFVKDFHCWQILENEFFCNLQNTACTRAHTERLTHRASASRSCVTQNRWAYIVLAHYQLVSCSLLLPLPQGKIKISPHRPPPWPNRWRSVHA
jgi:hypothetical protein